MKESERRRARHVTIFLDVDGVLNSYPVTGWRFTQEHRKKAYAWRYELHFRPKIVKALERLVANRNADIVWLSTWSHLCRTEIEPKLGFERSYPIIPMPDNTFNRFAHDPQAWWKAIAIEQWLANNPGKRAVWVDDDLVHPTVLTHFATSYGSRMLLVAPEYTHGLDEDHLEQIEAFTYPRPTDSEPALADDYEIARTTRDEVDSSKTDFVVAGVQPDAETTDPDSFYPDAPAGPDLDKMGQQLESSVQAPTPDALSDSPQRDHHADRQ